MNSSAKVAGVVILILAWIALTARAYRHQDPPVGSLVICGGGNLPREIREEFIRLAGGRDARIVVIPTATSNADDTTYLESLYRDWAGYEVSILHTRSRRQANDPNFVRPLKQATAVWFGGGDQVFLTDAYLGTLVQEEIKAVLERGGVIGGTSAGAAVMSDVMIRGGESVAEVGRGFGFLTDAVVDQHFLKRHRMGRLAGVVTQHPGILGVGIDEGTALVIRGDEAKVIGESCVLTCSSRGYESFGPGDQTALSQLRSR